MAKVKDFFASLLKAITNLPTSSKRFAKSDGGTTIFSSLFCILIGLIIGLIVLIIIKPTQGFAGFADILTGAFILPSATGLTIANTATLILVGLSVTFAFKCGLFNIGVAGQFLMGILGCLVPALMWNAPWFICLLCGGLLGALWGVIPGLLKTYCNVNEVITSIMTNWIALLLVNEIVKTSSMYNSERNETFNVSGSSLIPDWFGFSKIFQTNEVTIAIILAILISIATYFFLTKTKYGYELRACGLNKDAAKYSGINHRKNIILAMGVAGMFAGMAAGLHYLSGVEQYNPNFSTMLPAIGFDGISVALIGGLNPIGCVFSALLMAILSRGSSLINTVYFPPEMANLMFGIIIFLCAFSGYFKSKIAKILNKEKETEIVDVNSIDVTNTLVEPISKEENNETTKQDDVVSKAGDE